VIDDVQLTERRRRGGGPVKFSHRSDEPVTATVGPWNNMGQMDEMGEIDEMKEIR